MLLPNPGAVCKFLFTSRFVGLNGIYFIQQIMPFSQAINDGVDFVKSLYVPVGLAKSDFGNDWQSYTHDDVLRLQLISDATVVIYVPSLVLAAIPDPMIQCYNDYAISIRLGLFENTDSFRWLIDELNLMAANVTGTTDAVEVFSLDTTWMSTADYNAQDAIRKTRTQQLQTIYEALQSQITTNNELKTKIVYYENTLKALNAAKTGG